MAERYDVIIVGNGALGLFLALELARSSYSIAVVGEPGRSGGASRAAGVMLGLFGEVTKDTFATVNGRAKFALGLAAHKLWPAVIEELSAVARDLGESLHVVNATHVILNGCGGSLDTANYKAIIAALKDHGMQHDEVNPEDVPGYRPRADGRALRCVRAPGEGAVDGNHVLRLMDMLLSRASVRFQATPAQHLLSRNSRITGVRLRDGETIESQVVVVAAGVHTVDLLRTVLDPTAVQPMLAGIGTSVVTERVAGDPFETVVRTPNRGGACGLHLVPMGGGREYAGASNLVSQTAELRSTIAAASAILQQLVHQLDEGAGGNLITEWRVGNRPVPLDGFPLIGWTSVSGLYSLSGTYRDGFHAAPALAAHVANEISGGPGIFDLPFAPEREPIASWTVAESIEEYSTHMTSLWFELGGRAPPTHPTLAITERYRDEAQRLYERLGVEIGLNPEVLSYMTSLHDKLELRALLKYLRARGAAVRSDKS